MSEQRVLVVQTASPAFVKRAMEDILAKNLLGPVRITVFCRALPEELVQFQGVPWIHALCVHNEMRDALKRLVQLRQARYDVVVAFFSRDPSYWKMKYFVFICRGRHLLIFNEHLGCFFFTPSAFWRFSMARYKEWKLRTKQQLGYALGTPQGFIERPSTPGLAFFRPFHLTLKVCVFPFRLLYLLLWTSYMRRRRRRFLEARHDILQAQNLK